jgi:hypothetical protein
MLLKGVKAANVLGILEGIGSGLTSHNRPNCQALLAGESMLSTALESIA